MKQLIIIASCISLFFLPGCGTAPIVPYQPPSASASERAAQESGVEVALDPFVERAREEKYFDIDAVANGIAILHVRVANKTGDQTFFVKKQNFQLLRNGAGDLTSDGKSTDQSSVAGQVMGVLGAGAVMGLFGSSLVSHAVEVKRNFTSKEMGDQTLSPGDSMDGFIYFGPIAQGKDWTRAAAVKINVIDTKTQKVIALNISLSQ
jgi:hypothetical protein